MTKERGKYWCWTWFGATEETAAEDADRVHGLFEGIPPGYACCQLERCPETGRLHLQGYLQLPDRKTTRQVANAFAALRLPGVHLERARGSSKQGRDYARKEDTRIAGPWEVGTFAGTTQGRRTDMESMRLRLRDGARRVEIADEFFSLWCRYPRSISEYSAMVQPPRTWETEVSILWGETGAGKTRSVYTEWGDTGIYDVPRPNSRTGATWFDGYDSEETVLFDDFYGWVQLTLLTRLLDRYACRAPTKGGFVNWVPRRVIFTSNNHPSTWYRWDVLGKPLLRAFQRRLTHVIRFRLLDGVSVTESCITDWE